MQFLNSKYLYDVNMRHTWVANFTYEKMYTY